ncbi:MAG: response regulator [Ferruginibacter sp.]
MEQNTALIVDDEADTCFLLKHILKQMDYSASFVHTLSDADRELEAGRPDVIFLDNHLKDGTGIDHIPSILHRHPAVKIILITAFDTPVYRTQASQKGAHHFMGKPFSKKTISEALDAVFP